MHQRLPAANEAWKCQLSMAGRCLLLTDKTSTYQALALHEQLSSTPDLWCGDLAAVGTATFC